MNFKEATDSLFDQISHDLLAKTLGVSVASIRQARLRPVAAAHRAPPEKWRESVIRLAEDRQRHFQGLIKALSEENRGVSDQGDSYLRKKHSYISIA